MKQADFYILPCADDEGKYRFLGKLLTRILSGGHHIHLYCDDEYSAKLLADALWHFSDTSFLANATPEQPMIAPINIGWDDSHLPKHRNVLVNYAQTIPQGAAEFERVVEIVIAQEESLALSRERYSHYKSQGFTIKHNDMRPAR